LVFIRQTLELTESRKISSEEHAGLSTNSGNKKKSIKFLSRKIMLGDRSGEISVKGGRIILKFASKEWVMSGRTPGTALKTVL
jgi:hypothetical protein